MDSREDPQDEEEPKTLHCHNLPKEASVSIRASSQTGWAGLPAVSSSGSLQLPVKMQSCVGPAEICCIAPPNLYAITQGRSAGVKGAATGSDELKVASSPLSADWVVSRGLKAGSCGSWQQSRQNKLQFCWANSFPDSLLCRASCVRSVDTGLSFGFLVICFVEHRGSCPDHLKLQCWPSKINRIIKCPNQIHRQGCPHVKGKHSFEHNLIMR